MESLVSIIIPLYNRENLISETLKSIGAQTYEKWECIIIDDHSTDNSFQVVRQFIKGDSRFLIQKRPDNRTKGANACRNYGFEISSGSFINWFDSDDIMHPDFILEKLKVIQNNDHDGVISKTAIFLDDPAIIRSKEQRTAVTDNLLEDFLSLKIAWYLPDVMWNRSFLNDKVLFDEQLMAGQDRDFHSRMLLDDPDLIVVDNYLTFYRKHDENITSNIDDLKNRHLKLSHMYSVDKLIDRIFEKGKMTKNIRSSLFSSMAKYLPFVLGNKADFNILKALMKKLSYPNLGIGILWLKFYTALISFKLFGKGSRLLR